MTAIKVRETETTQRTQRRWQTLPEVIRKKLERGVDIRTDAFGNILVGKEQPDYSDVARSVQDTEQPNSSQYDKSVATKTKF